MPTRALLLPCALLPLLAACGGDEAASGPDRATAESGLPEGVWRVEVTEADVAAAGMGNGEGWSGTWTLRLDDGTFVLTCVPVDRPGRDCGNSDVGPDVALEAGTTRVEGDVVVFEHREDKLAELTGCVPTGGTGAGERCFPNTDYAVSFRREGDQLRFSDLQYGPGDLLPIEPWSRIS